MLRTAAMVVSALSLTGCFASGGPGCPSVYDGSYNGILQYEWEKDNGAGGTTTGSGEVRTQLTFACDEVVDGEAHLSVTHAMADDPYFGCTLDGCTPDNALSLAYLPANPPAEGTGKIAVYMKQGNFYTQGKVSVTGGGVIISSPPGGGDVTWYGFGGATDFPGDGKLVVRWPKWTFTKSAK